MAGDTKNSETDGDELMKYPDDYINKVLCADCLEVMKGIPDGSIDLVLTDPPYNLNKGFANDNTDYPKYLKMMESVIVELVRLLKNEGSLWLFCEQKSHAYIYVMIDGKLNIRNSIIWHYSNGMVSQGCFVKRYEPIIYANKGENRCFNGNDIRIPRLRIDKCYVDRYNPDGKIPEDVWHFEREVYTPNRIPHPTVKPLDLISTITKVSSNIDDIILDPFAGSGTTLVAAKNLGRRFIGIEISPEYCKIANQRLAQEILL